MCARSASSSRSLRTASSSSARPAIRPVSSSVRCWAARSSSFEARSVRLSGRQLFLECSRPLDECSSFLLDLLELCRQTGHLVVELAGATLGRFQLFQEARLGRLPGTELLLERPCAFRELAPLLLESVDQLPCLGGVRGRLFRVAAGVSVSFAFCSRVRSRRRQPDHGGLRARSRAAPRASCEADASERASSRSACTAPKPRSISRKVCLALSSARVTSSRRCRVSPWACRSAVRADSCSDALRRASASEVVSSATLGPGRCSAPARGSPPEDRHSGPGSGLRARPGPVATG